MRKISTYIILCGLVLGGCQSQSTHENTSHHIRTKRDSLLIDNEERHFIKGIKPGVNQLVIALHGAKEKDWMMEFQSELNALTIHNEDNPFNVIYPQGEYLQWNDARGTTKSSQLGVNDVAFIDSLIEATNTWAGVKQKTIYLIGYSNGALMAQTYALQTKKYIDGIAMMAGPMPKALLSTELTNKKLKVIYFEGAKDPIMPIAGGRVNSCSGGDVLSAMESGRFWCEQLGGENCSSPSALEFVYSEEWKLKEINFFEYQTKTGAVQLILLRNGGHQIPGGLRLIPKKTFGPYQPFPALAHAFNFLKK